HLAHEGHARDGDADIAAPAMGYRNIGERGIDLADLAADVAFDIGARLAAIDFAPAEQEPPAAEAAEVAHDEARIVDRLAAGQDRTVRAERLGRADEGADRHDVGGADRFERAAIGIDGDEAMAGSD